MIRTLLTALGAAIAYTAPARPYTLRDRCADAQARAADPAVADDARALLAAHEEIARLREDLDNAWWQIGARGDAYAHLHGIIARHKAARKRAGRMVGDLVQQRRRAHVVSRRARCVLSARNRALRQERDRYAAHLREALHLGPEITLLTYQMRQKTAQGLARDAAKARDAAQAELAICRADRDAALDRLQALMDERHAPPSAAPAKTLRDFVRDELEREGYALDAIGVMRRDEWHIELRDDHLTRRWTVTGPVATYPYRPEDAEGTMTDIGAVIERAVAAFDAAGGGR
jgi:hypothetical protein